MSSRLYRVYKRGEEPAPAEFSIVMVVIDVVGLSGFIQFCEKGLNLFYIFMGMRTDHPSTLSISITQSLNIALTLTGAIILLLFVKFLGLGLVKSNALKFLGFLHFN